MNFLDIAILVLLTAFLIKGLVRGLLKEFCSLLGLVAGAVLAFRFHAPLAALMTETLGLPPRLCVVAAFLALFLATIGVFALIGYLLSRFLTLLFLGGLNRVAGGFFGLAQGTLLLAVMLFAASRGSLPESMGKVYKGSRLAPPFVQLGQATFQGSRHLLASWR